MKGQGSIINSELHGQGLVLSCTPSRDVITKKKYWTYSVQFNNQDGTTFVEDINEPAEEAIRMFSNHEADQLPKDFPLAQFKGSFEETLAPVKISIERIIQKLNLKETHMHEVDHWENFWNAQPYEVSGVSHTSAFAIPPPQEPDVRLSKSILTTHVDDGNREVQQVLYAGYSQTQQSEQIQTRNALIPSTMLEPLEQGNFVVVDMQPANAEWYTLPFLICEIIQDVSLIDTTLPDQIIGMRALRPTF